MLRKDIERKLIIKIYNDTNTIVQYNSEDSGRTWGVDSGSFEYETQIMDEDVKYGQLFSDMVRMKVFGISENLEGRRIDVTMERRYIQNIELQNDSYENIINNDNEDILSGAGGSGTKRINFSGYVESCKADGVGGDYIVTAYDKYYFVRDINVADFWNTYINNHQTVQLRTFISDLLSYVGIADDGSFSVLPSLTFTKLKDVYSDTVQSITFGELFSMCCEIYGIFPTMYSAEVASYSTIYNNVNEMSDNIEKTESEWESYSVDAIDGVAFYGTTNELLYATSGATNAYTIIGNLFLSAATASELENAASVLINKTNLITTYVPCHAKLVISQPTIIRQRLKVNGVESLIMHERIYGDKFIDEELWSYAKGKTRSTDIYNPYSDIVLGQKFSKIERDVDNILITVGNTYVTKADYDAEVQSLQDQIDGHIDYWDGNNTVPTLSNAPAVDWTTEQLKNLHLGDLYRNHYTVGTSDVVDYYRFDKDTSVMPNTFSWVLLGAGDIDEALRKADEANRKADEAQAQLDTLQNHVDNDLYTKVQTDAKIQLSANSITQSVSATYETKLDSEDKLTTAQGYANTAENNAKGYTNTKLQSYYTKTETESKIEQKIGEIDLSVYETKTHASGEVTRLESDIKLTKQKIVLKVSNNHRIVEVGLEDDPSSGTPATFYVDADYINLSAQHKLTLTTGVFEVNSTYLQISGTGAVSCTSMDIDGGDINLGNGVFHVDNLGQLYCSNAEVEGIIRATSGEIGDLTLANGVLSNTYSGSSMTIDTNNCMISFDDGDNKIEIQDGNIIGYNYLSLQYGVKWYEACSIEVYRGEMVIGAEDLYLGGYQYNYVSDTKTFNDAVHIDEYGFIYATSVLSATGSLWVEGGLSVEDGLTVRDTGLTVTEGDVEIQDGGLSVNGAVNVYDEITTTGEVSCASLTSSGNVVASGGNVWAGSGSETTVERQNGVRVSQHNCYTFVNTDGRCGLYSSKWGDLVTISATGNRIIGGNVYIGTQCYVANNRVFTTADASTGGVTHNYNTVAWIKSDGGMEIGYYIDFHDGHDSDKEARILYSYSNNRLEATPSIVSTSSRKVKKNIDDITDEEANLILQLRPRKFDYKSTQTDNQSECGFIAEEVQDIIPNLVCEEEGEEGTKSWMPMGLKYDDIIAYLVKVVQRQEREINELKGE